MSIRAFSETKPTWNIKYPTYDDYFQKKMFQIVSQCSCAGKIHDEEYKKIITTGTLLEANSGGPFLLQMVDQCCSIVFEDVSGDYVHPLICFYLDLFQICEQKCDNVDNIKLHGSHL